MPGSGRGRAETDPTRAPRRAAYFARALPKSLKKLPWAGVPVGSRSTERGHGRQVTRTIKVADAPTDLPGWAGSPGAVQVAQLPRARVEARTAKKTVEVVYLITSATHHSAPPAVLTAWVLSHWSVENKLHWVRDVTFDEDRSQVRTGHAPRIMATLRNTAISILPLTGSHEIAAALRRHARDPAQAITRALTC